jgi:hypothetical protein
MAKDTPRQTLTDYLVLAIAPALIMVMVGSLVQFLIQVVYGGEHAGRLQWILFFFVFGAVLNSRIALSGEIADRAGVYGALLGFLTWLGLQQFVEYTDAPALAALRWAIHLGFIALIWFCADRLVKDCTDINEEEESAGEGLLQASGLEQCETPAEAAFTEEEGKQLNWLERWQRYREAQKKKRTPGVWIIYFSLAALPLFGLGQALIPVEEETRRRTTFWLLVCYVAAGIGLMLTTCFLGLRRYLRQKNLQMPAAMTGTWLTVGAGLIGAMLLVAAIIPRPEAEYSPFDFTPLGSKKRDASKFAMTKDSAGKDKGRPLQPVRDKDAPQDKSARDKPADKDKGQPQRDKDRGSGDKDQNRDQGSKDKSQDKDRGSGDKDQKDGQSGKKDEQRDRTSGEKDQKRDQTSAEKDRKDAQPQKDRKDAPPPKDQPQRDKQQGDKPPNESQTSDQQQQSQSSWQMPAWLNNLGPILKWICFAVLLALVGFYILRAGLSFLANFTKWARDLLNAFRRLWEWLFGARGGEEEVEWQSVEGGKPPRPFAAFSNPFHDGSAARRTPAELVRYTFAALQAWAWEHDLGRGTDETALEYAVRLGNERPGLEHDVQRLAQLFVRAAYARGSLPGMTVEVLEQFWDRLAAAEERPLSV